MHAWFPCFFGVDLHAYSTFMGSFLSVRAVDQQRKQVAVRFYSRWYIMRPRVGILARQISLAMKKVVEI